MLALHAKNQVNQVSISGMDLVEYFPEFYIQLIGCKDCTGSEDAHYRLNINFVNMVKVIHTCLIFRMSFKKIFMICRLYMLKTLLIKLVLVQYIYRSY